MTIGERLKEARKYCGETQADVAVKLGVSFQTLSSWENDRTRPNPEDLIVLSKIYGISIDVLLGVPPKRATVLPRKFDILLAYDRAPAEIKNIVNTALAPYRTSDEIGKALQEQGLA
jgi:transcriptional regulator with XRE-family HTH domain